MNKTNKKIDFLPFYEKLAKEKNSCLKKPFFERNRCFLNFHKKLISYFLVFLKELRTSKDNSQKLDILLEYITPFAIDEDDIYFCLQTNLEDIAWKIKELLLDALEEQKPLNENQLKEIELMIREELQSFKIILNNYLMKNKNFYSDEFRKLTKARKADSIYGIGKNLVKKEPQYIKKALLNLLVNLEKLIQNPKLKYSDLSLFVIDPKFLFPHKKTNLTLEEIGPTLIVSSKGLLYELFKALDLEKHAELIIKLQKAIKDLHSALSQQKKDLDKYKENVLKIIRRLKDIIVNNQLVKNHHNAIL